MDAHCVWEAGAQLGEGPVWSPSRNALFAVDIRGSRLLRYSPADGRGRDWPLEEAACWLVERADGGFVAGLRSRRLVGLTLDGDRLSVGLELLRLEEDTPGNRLNDAMADTAGRLWVGSMDDAEQDASGALYRIGPDGSVARADEGYTVSNGPALSPDGRTLYHTDSPSRTIFAFTLAADGTLSGKRVHIRFDEEDGYPDGMTCDAEGHLWVAHWSGGGSAASGRTGLWIGWCGCRCPTSPPAPSVGRGWTSCSSPPPLRTRRTENRWQADCSPARPASSGWRRGGSAPPEQAASLASGFDILV
ncbi:SMP-30/gluconolactonase/LRE family protein [Azospirillum brasilense]|uniref:SMP-30/gluconolactonase/LRE family protein n=1 Tax=Azospirillum brasilense TaxID=192 RepID=A0A4D8QMR8_AZOBR|nr:SMP-30/gluconolactonase/LRE family protein [Azospirillum argentinense]